MLRSTGPASPAKGEVTGTIARTPADSRTARPGTPVAQPPAADGLPTAIGGARLRNAAAAGDPAAAYEVAMRFMEGRGVPANLEEAAKWLERAASKGLAPAQFRYASMLEKGQGVRKDLAAAQKLYVTAAAKGHAKAMHNLAVLYAEGVDGKPDYANAVLWFRKAAEHGVADSQFNLAVLVARGLGTEKNIAESYKWFALAAAQGDRDAGRKRDDAAAALDAPTLAAAQDTVKNFVARSAADGCDCGSGTTGRLGSGRAPTTGQAARRRSTLNKRRRFRKAVTPLVRAGTDRPKSNPTSNPYRSHC